MIVVFVLNRSYNLSVEGCTPYEAWHGGKPDVQFPCVFGRMAHVKETKPRLKKLDDHTKPMVTLIYEPDNKAYRLYHPINN